MASSGSHPPETRERVEGLLRETGLSMAAIAARAGVARETVRRWNREACIRPRVQAAEARPATVLQKPARRGAGRLGPPGDVPDLATLDAALRVHIARQIVAFDDRLRAADPTAALDTARILRDLGGLKRLLDDLGAAARQSESDGDADGGAQQDLAALRERLARRIEAFVSERPDTAAAGEPGP